MYMMYDKLETAGELDFEILTIYIWGVPSVTLGTNCYFDIYNQDNNTNTQVDVILGHSSM